MTPEERSDAREWHSLVMYGRAKRCRDCGDAYPCVTVRLLDELERVEAALLEWMAAYHALDLAHIAVEAERDMLRAAAQKVSDEMPCVSDVLGGPVCSEIGRGLCTFCELRAVLAGSGQVEVGSPADRRDKVRALVNEIVGGYEGMADEAVEDYVRQILEACGG